MRTSTVVVGATAGSWGRTLGPAAVCVPFLLSCRTYFSRIFLARYWPLSCTAVHIPVCKGLRTLWSHHVGDYKYFYVQQYNMRLITMIILHSSNMRIVYCCCIHPSCSMHVRSYSVVHQQQRPIHPPVLIWYYYDVIWYVPSIEYYVFVHA